MKEKKATIKVEYPEEKLKALVMSLRDKQKNSEKETTLEDEIIKIIDNLYEKNVPKILKKYIQECEDMKSSHDNW